MLNFSSVMIGSHQPRVLAKFYEKVFGKKADWEDGNWYGWAVGNTHITIGEHSEVKGKAKEPQRIILNFETEKVQKEFDRIRQIKGAEVVKEPYEMSSEGGSASGGHGMWIATFADPDGNYFQLMSPWEEDTRN